MTEEQKKKRNFRQSKKWKDFKKKKKAECGGVDYITQYPLRKGFQLHHLNLRSEDYENLDQDFLCCNRMTHEFIHWCWRYYKNDKGFIIRLENILDRMFEINNKGVKE